jgi:predicted type IV restriction endonuclease
MTRTIGGISNLSEFELEQHLKEKSVDFQRRGFPDYAIIKDRKIIGFIEVKPRKSKILKKEQQMFADFCVEHNIPHAVWTPDDKLPNWI